jgi:hypothetical protein
MPPLAASFIGDLAKEPLPLAWLGAVAWFAFDGDDQFVAGLPGGAIALPADIVWAEWRRPPFGSMALLIARVPDSGELLEVSAFELAPKRKHPPRRLQLRRLAAMAAAHSEAGRLAAATHDALAAIAGTAPRREHQPDPALASRLGGVRLRPWVEFLPPILATIAATGGA